MWMPTTTYKNLPATYWKQEANRREFMDYIKRQLGGTYEDLYNISNQTVISAGGMCASEIQVLKFYIQHCYIHIQGDLCLTITGSLLFLQLFNCTPNISGSVGNFLDCPHLGGET